MERENKENVSKQEIKDVKVELNKELRYSNINVRINNIKKLIINNTAPHIQEEWVLKQLPENTKILTFNRQLNIDDINTLQKDNKSAIIQINPQPENSHTMFFDGKKIWDSWRDVFNMLKKENINNPFYSEYSKYNKEMFELNAPQQKLTEYYCVLFSLAIARLRAKGEKLETMDEMLQAQTIRDELATFVEINSKMHVNGIQIFG